MTATDPRLIRRLTGSYLSDPRPDDWQVAADHFEESGDIENARLWRRRGQWYLPLRQAFDWLIPDAARGLSSVAHPGVFQVDFRRSKSCVCITATWGRAAIRDGRGKGNQIQLREADNPVARRRFTSRLVGLIDELALIEHVGREIDLTDAQRLLAAGVLYSPTDSPRQPTLYLMDHAGRHIATYLRAGWTYLLVDTVRRAPQSLPLGDA